MEMGLGIVVPVILIISSSVLGFIWYKSHKKLNSAVVKQETTPQQTSSSHIQQKEELDAKETGKHELAGNMMCELDGQAIRVEASDGERETRMPSSLLARHELLGDEHAKELEVAPEK